jgi:transcriptional regulator with XRE-family HTH domain
MEKREIYVAVAADGKPIAAALHAARKAYGYTVRALAEYLGITAGYLSGMEKGRRTLSVEIIERLPDPIRLDVQRARRAALSAELTAIEHDIASIASGLHAPQPRRPRKPAGNAAE